MDVTTAFLRQRSGGKAEIVQDLRFTRRDNRMHSIEPQPVETVVAQPIQRILDEEAPYFRYAIVDRAAPRRLRVGKELRCDAAEIITLRAEVVVDDVDENHQPVRVGGIDQRLEIVRTAVTRVGGERQNAVVAPVPAPRKI